MYQYLNSQFTFLRDISFDLSGVYLKDSIRDKFIVLPNFR